MVSPILFIVLPLATAFLMILLNNKIVSLVMSLLVSIALSALAIFWFPLALKSPQDIVVASIPAPLGIPLSLDAAGAFLALIVTFSYFLVILYSSAYMKNTHAPTIFYTVLLLLVTASLGLVLTRDIFNFFVFFEILCIASFILVAWEQDGFALEASFKYMVLASIGSTFILVAIALAYKTAGSLAMADIAKAFAEAPNGTTLLSAVLFLFGIGVEAAIFPVNTWLPDAHSSAPSPISAVLSGFVIELTLIVSFRIFSTVFGNLNLMPVLAVLALLGVVVGEFTAFSQTELKRALAYSSIGQIGIMLFALSLGTTEGISAGLSHLVMHAGAKSVLFLVAGYFILRTGSRLIEDYRGLGRRMPFSAVLFALAALSLVGMPPLLGFFTKFQILSAAISKGNVLGWIGVVVILFGTVLETIYLLRVVRVLFSEESKGVARGTVKEMDFPALIAVTLFATVFVFGIFFIVELSSATKVMADALTVIN